MEDVCVCALTFKINNYTSYNIKGWEDTWLTRGRVGYRGHENAAPGSYT